MSEPQTYTVSDRPLKCPHCGGDHFHHRRILLNTRAMTFLDLDWLNAAADVYVCAQCGHLTWFANESAATEETSTELMTCLSCGTIIPPGDTACPKCGWTYQE